MMAIENDKTEQLNIWLRFFEDNKSNEKSAIVESLTNLNISSYLWKSDSACGPGIIFFSSPSNELYEFAHISSISNKERVLAIANSPLLLRENNCGWRLLRAGVSDVITWSNPEEIASEIKARFSRWLTVDQLLESQIVTSYVIGNSQAWRTKLREIVEIAKFTCSSALILGESGTGKELVAHLIHELDPRPNKRDFVILDCSTVIPELSGSEFFGHERGAFTGAVSERVGAFALADGGTLFLDEIGELPLTLQAQLLRVIQEHTYKRVGGNSWQRTEFRLICATNRNLEELVRLGKFRADLYYRIASFICKLPPLRERIEDIIPLAENFICRNQQNHEPIQFDNAVREYLLNREYPGNVRDLSQVVSRLLQYYAGNGGVITIGNVPPEDRPVADQESGNYFDDKFKQIIRRAVLSGVGLKEIGRTAEDCAIRIAIEEENGNLQRAARRLGVTDRTLQMRTQIG